VPAIEIGPASLEKCARGKRSQGREVYMESERVPHGNAYAGSQGNATREPRKKASEKRRELA